MRNPLLVTPIYKAEDGTIWPIRTSPWAYRSVPLGQVSAADQSVIHETARPLLAALTEIGKLSRATLARRRAPGSLFRTVHILTIDIPQRFRAPSVNPLAPMLNSWLASSTVRTRRMLIGVRLEPTFPGGWRGAVEGVKLTSRALFDPTGIPPQLFEVDLNKVGEAFDRAGSRPATVEEMKLATAFWNWGRWPDTPIIPHVDHIHILHGGEALSTLNRAKSRGEADLADCSTWPSLSGTHAISFGSVYDFEEDSYAAPSQQALWGKRLFREGAVVVSIRGQLEPAAVTRNELRRRVKQLSVDIAEREAAAKLERAEQTQLLLDLKAAEDLYSDPDSPPTLTRTVITVGFSGRDIDWDGVSLDTGLSVRPLDWRQEEAFAEVQIGSAVRANPHLHDLPVTAVTYAGLGEKVEIGDSEVDGALLGFTEAGQQPVWLSHKAASAVDAMPFLLIAGATGSGKTMLGAWLAVQWAGMGLGRPVIFINPKQGDTSLDELVRKVGGRIVTLDSLTSADGAFDAFRFTEGGGGATDAATLAASYLTSANPWGRSMLDRPGFEASLIAALSRAQARGAKSTIQALEMGVEEGFLTPQDLTPVRNAMANPLFRLGCGTGEAGIPPLRDVDGLTLLNAGGTFFDLPRSPNQRDWTLSQRISVATLRLLVYGAGFALSNREGVVFFDEAWTFLTGEGAKTEVERLGRLARSLNFLPVMLTQRVVDAIRAEVHGYISRLVILPLGSLDEAEAAVQMLRYEDPTPHLTRLTLPKDPTGSNFASMHALRNPLTRQVIRPPVAIVRDLAGRNGYVVTRVPDWLLELASTNPEDKKRREGR